MNICVYGASGTDLQEEYYSAAFQLGVQLARKGHGLVFGAGQHGLMGSCAQGVKSEGGHILGIAPSFFNEPGILFPACSELILTDTMRERKQIMEDRSDAVVVLPGGIGTLEEFFEILTLKQLGKTSKPIAILNTLNYFDPMLQMLAHTADQHFMSSNCLHLFHVCNTAPEAVEYLESAPLQTGNLHRLEDYTR